MTDSKKVGMQRILTPSSPHHTWRHQVSEFNQGKLSEAENVGLEMKVTFSSESWFGSGKKYDP